MSYWYGDAERELVGDGFSVLSNCVGDDGNSLSIFSSSTADWRVSDPGGTLTITEFDDDSITGTFEFPMEDSLASIGGDPSEGTIMVTGNFDFNRPLGT